MAQLTRQEFADHCGVTVNVLNTHVVRGKVLVQKNGKIDPDHPANVKYRVDREHWIEKKRLRGVNKKLKKQIVPKEKQIDYSRITQKKAEQGQESDIKPNKRSLEEKQLTDWVLRKEQASAIKAEKEAQLKTLQVEKMMGKLLPVDLVHQILKINIQNIFVKFEAELINIASIYCDILADGDRGKLADITTRMRDNLERIIQETETSANKEIDGAIDEYSETRSRGERA